MRFNVSTVLIYGPKGILIANVPRLQDNLSYRAERGGIDKPLVCHVIEYRKLIFDVEVVDC